MARQESISKDKADEQEVPTSWRVSNVLVRILYFWTIFGVITLSLRVLLLAFSANPATGFVTFIYDTSSRYLEPFRGIFPTRGVGEAGYLDVSALFAIIMYMLFLWAVLALIDYVERNMQNAAQDAAKNKRV